MKQIALIGPTASGKSALAIEVARESGAIILSLDSLAIYKGFNIVSAKPTPQERGTIPHLGIDLLEPDQHFSVERYITLYHQAREQALQEGRDLIIVGGTLFYLKALLQGLSSIPSPSPQCLHQVQGILSDLDQAYKRLLAIDPTFASKIAPQDRYRIEKGLLIFCMSGLPPTQFFARHPPRPIIDDLPIFSIQIDRRRLRANLQRRTAAMIELGLIDEIYNLERRYGRGIHPMKAIGVVETLAYLDGRYTLAELREKITTNSARLAKRQQTFIRTQFPQAIPIAPGEIQPLLQALTSGS
ncbi:MAG: tRNA (adenosine(37)-N6)-dimethylallyltransferase MiaA [Epsilonproteobacteria bacterium]|nr:tRNA (adenosine(37)-N6)-dimethylallyltransferase MiaA [Campylobacterota bacterium]